MSDDYDEKRRIASALGPSAHTLLMRHHGAATCGATVAEAWVRYYYLDRICTVQCLASARPCLSPDRSVLAHGLTQLGPGGPYAHGKFEWDALVRLAGRLQTERANKGRGVVRSLPRLTTSPLAAAPSAPAPAPLAPAAAPSGTAAALRALDVDGYCVLDGVIGADVVGALRESGNGPAPNSGPSTIRSPQVHIHLHLHLHPCAGCSRLALKVPTLRSPVSRAVMATTAVHRNPNAPKTIGHVPGLMAYDQCLAPYLAHPALLGVVEGMFGAGAKITFCTGQTNHPGCERQEWHADWPFAQTGSAHIPAPYADTTCHLTVLLMLDAMTTDNGTILLPGSHKAATNPTVAGVMDDPLAAHPHEVRATGAAGSVLVIDSRLWHCIPPNPTTTSRVAVAVRYAPWWLDTSVIMPGSAARRRVVDGIGRPTDAGGTHAGIPLGNPSQPPLPPAAHASLLAAGGGAAQTAAMYTHWLRPPISPPEVPAARVTSTTAPLSLDEAEAALSPTAQMAVLDACAALQGGSGGCGGGYGGGCGGGECGFHLLRASGAGAAAAAAASAVATVPEASRSVATLAAVGALDLPIALAVAKRTLGDFFRICDVAPKAPGPLDSTAALACAWPYCDGGRLAAPFGTPPLAGSQGAEACLVLHVYVALEGCVLQLQPRNGPATPMPAAPAPAPTTVQLRRGDVLMLDGRTPFRWLSGGGGGAGALRVSYAAWWFDGSLLAEGSLQRRRAIDAFRLGAGPAPPPPRPALHLSDGAIASRPVVWDILQHWEVEQAGPAAAHGPLLSASSAADEAANEGAPLAACRLPLLAAYGRIWALQQLLQCGLFDVLARYALQATGPAGMGERSFMAAKVRTDDRAIYLLPLLVGAAWHPSAPVLLASHLANIYLHASRSPFIWDHELWDMLTELVVVGATVAHLLEAWWREPARGAGGEGHATMPGPPATNQIIARSAPTVRSMMTIFYAAAAFWKLNSSFFDPIASCAPVFVLQLVAAYLPEALTPPALIDVVAWTAPHVATCVEIAIPLLLSQAQRPNLRRLGLCLGLLFHFLIALTPPPNNAGGFSVGAIVRYFFFLPRATAASLDALFGGPWPLSPPSLSAAAAAASDAARTLVALGSSPRRLAAVGAVGLAVGTAASQGSVTLQGSLPIFIVLLLVYVRALYLSFRYYSATGTTDDGRTAAAAATHEAVATSSTAAAVASTPAPAAPNALAAAPVPAASLTAAAPKSSTAATPSVAARGVQLANGVLLSAAFVYAFVLPILGLQDIAACNMFANLHGPTAVVTGRNHFLVPTGLLQARYEHASPVDNPFAGGVVEILHTTSEWVRTIHPAESTSMLSSRTRTMLRHAGHAGREFGPSTTRVVGTLPGMRPPADASLPQLPYYLPALELRRLLGEARARNETLALTYRRVSRTGATFAGRVVDVADTYDSGRLTTQCTVRPRTPQLWQQFWPAQDPPGAHAGSAVGSASCEPEEIALLPPSDWWLTGLLLAFPLPMREDGIHEVGCLA